jgi:DNA-binding beta-propeller fold protein YncE
MIKRFLDFSGSCTFLLYASLIVFLAEPALTAQPGQMAFTADDMFTKVSDAFSPPVSYSIQLDDGELRLLIKVGTFAPDGHGASLAVGLGAQKMLRLSDTDAKISYGRFEADYVFSIAKSRLGISASGPPTLRFAFAVHWAGGPFGILRLKEQFRQRGIALTGDLSSNPQDWSEIDLSEQSALMAARQRSISINFKQPMDGKASIVIEDAHGNRIRNLLSGEPMSAGVHHVQWEGLDDQGNIVAPGTYHWKAVSHPGIRPTYLFSFYNHGNPPWRSAAPSSDWLADHTNPVAAASSNGRVYLAAPIAESGHAVVKISTDGQPTGHVDFPTLVGLGKLFLLADNTGFYVVMEGTPHYEPFRDGPNGSWAIRRPLNILHWDLSEQPVPYNGQRGEKVVTENLLNGTGAHPVLTDIPAANNLAGVAIVGRTIYISLATDNRIAEIDAATGQEIGSIPLQSPGLLAADGSDAIIGFSRNSLVRIELAGNRQASLFVPQLSALPRVGDPEESLYGFVGQNPTGMAVDPLHNIYLSDNGTDQNIKVFSRDGRLLRSIGTKGGRPATGGWIQNAVYRPHGIAIDTQNQLWVTETDTYPRRVSVWDAATGRFLRDYLGPAHYGAAEASFDPLDHTTWIAGGILWKLNFETKSATPLSVLFRQTKPDQLQTKLMGQYWNFYHSGGRTFLVGYGQGQFVYELQKNGNAKPWAFCGSLTALAQYPRWTLPTAIAQLPDVQALFAANARRMHVDPTLTPFGSWHDKATINPSLLQNVAVLWVDKNGDGVGEADEFEVLPSGDSLYTPGWGTGSPTLDMNIPAHIGGNFVILHIYPDGFLASGAPNYNLKKAIDSAVSLDFQPINRSDGGPSIQDHFGREIFNDTPMRGVRKDGKTLWTFPNRWVGVGGGHEAPLPTSGEMQGVMYFLGSAPLDSDSDVMVMNSNYGRFFVMTTDGIYLDEFFRDVRVSQTSDAYLIGGEPFGGYFGRGEDGKYYLQSGHTDYRIFEIDGLEQIKRSDGQVTVSKQQANDAQLSLEHLQAQSQESKIATVFSAASETSILDNPDQWPGNWTSIQWGDPSQTFPFAQVKAVRSPTALHLAYRVKDPSPWRNTGNDRTMLFKTGDSVDFQFSTDAAGDPNRIGPAPGDKRLLIAPFHQQSNAILYSYREPNATAPLAFSSPWRSERVDRVIQLKDARISTVIGSASYELRAVVPLSDLGLPGPGSDTLLRGDFGVIYGDADGTVDQLRSYWSNKATGIVNDVPGEVTVTPRLWGQLHFEAATQ